MVRVTHAWEKNRTNQKRWSGNIERFMWKKVTF